MNRIEKAWAALGVGLDRRHPQNEEGFRRIAQQEWKKIPDATLGRFIDELPDVMRAVHAEPHKHCSL